MLRATGAGVAAALLALLVLRARPVRAARPRRARGGAGRRRGADRVRGGRARRGRRARGRRRWRASEAAVEIVVVGAVGPGVACAVLSLALSVAASVDPGRALLELAMIAAGAAAGAWALPAVARLLARLRGTRGQTSAEYMGALLLVAVIIGALLASGVPARSPTGCRAPSTRSPGATGRGRPRTRTTGDRTPDRRPDRRRRRRRPHQRGGGRARHRPRRGGLRRRRHVRHGGVRARHRSQPGHRPADGGERRQAVGAARDQRGRLERPRGVDPRRDQPRRLEELPARRRGREHHPRRERRARAGPARRHGRGTRTGS